MESYSTLMVLIIAPFVLGLLSLVAPKALQRPYAIIAALGLLCITLFQGASILFSNGASEPVTQVIPWLPSLGTTLSLKLDHISVWFVLMNAFTGLIAFSLSGNWYRKSPRFFTFLGFALIGLTNGAFLSNDLVFFYIFYESVFIPIIFMVGIWGMEAKATAVFKFFLMSLFGSILMLVSIFYLVSMYHESTGSYSTNINDLIQVAVASKDHYQIMWCFIGFFLAFGIKVPLVPMHAWVKDVYTLAPMPATIWLSAILSKLGVFGFIRFVIPLFTDLGLQYQSGLLWLCAISVLYSGLLALRTNDPKTLLAYSSISHLGFVMIGVFAFKNTGAEAAVLLSFGHTLVSGILFYLLNILESKREKLNLEVPLGLAKHYPILFFLMFIAILAGISLPGTMNFIGEFLVLISAFSGNQVGVAVAGVGVILGAAYLLKFFQQLGLGTPSSKGDVKDIGFYDAIVIATLLVIVIFLGLQPVWILKGSGL